MFADCRDIGRPAIAGDLNATSDAGSQVRRKVICVLVIPLACQVRDNQLGAAVNSKKRVKIAAQLVAFSCPALAQSNPRPQFVKLDGFGLNLANRLIVEPFALLANDAHDFKHGVAIATRQPRGCPDADPLCQTAHDLNDFGFVQTQADEAALFVEGFATAWIEATEALHRAGAGFEAAEFLGFTATA